MATEKQIEALRRQLQEIAKLGGADARSHDFVRWQGATKRRIGRIFGEDSEHVKKFGSISYVPMVIVGDIFRQTEIDERTFSAGLEAARNQLSVMIDELAEQMELAELGPAPGIASVEAKQPSAWSAESSSEPASLRRQLAEACENLRLIQERKSQYVLETDIPLQLVKEERQLVERIQELEQRIQRSEATSEQTARPATPTESPRNVFISYSREDQTYTGKLVDSLLQRGFDVWIDDRIDFGERWWQSIVQAIRASAAFIVVMTPESEKSPWVERELLLALKEGKKIFPLLLRGEEFPILINTQYVDVRSGQIPPEGFYDRLRRVLPIVEVPESPPPQPKVRREGKVAPSGPAASATASPEGISPPSLAEPEEAGPVKRPATRTEVLDWLQEIAPPAAAAALAVEPEETVPVTPAFAPAEVPDWLQEIAPPEAAVVPEAEPEEAPSAELLPSPEGIPDWLQGIALQEVSAPETAPPAPEQQVPSQAKATEAPERLIALTGESAGPTGDRWRNPKSGKEMVRVPAGKFLYGDRKIQAELPEFWIDKAPVTNTEYAHFVAETGHEPPRHWEGKTPPKEIADHPVTNVTWHDATAYAAWAGGRLPTEEEWEKAARGTDGWEYPWGEWAEGRCNSFEASIRGTTPVGQYSPQGDSPYGCVDMAGNVWEWTTSEWVVVKYRVVRGGSWVNDRRFARCAYRNGFIPDFFNYFVGLRVMVSRAPGETGKV